MSTRSVTYFSDYAGLPPRAQASANKLIGAAIYRHSDGYPEGAGKDLLTFLAFDQAAGSRIGDVSYLAARYVAFLANQFNNGNRSRYDYTTKTEIPATGITNPCDFLSVGVFRPMMGQATDAEYEYWVDGVGAVYIRACSYGWGNHRANHGQWETLDSVLSAVNA